jgi:inorganic pyrophosphatase
VAVHGVRARDVWFKSTCRAQTRTRREITRRPRRNRYERLAPRLPLTERMKHIGRRWVHAVERSKHITEWVPYVSEISAGSRMKYALDMRSGQLCLNRAMADGIHYPTNYGFIPRTRSDADGMELDLMAISSEPLLPLTLARVRLVGGCTVHTSDESKNEDKLLGIVLGDPDVEKLIDINDVEHRLKSKIEEFFKTYKDDEGELAVVVRWFDRITALDKVKIGLKKAKRAEKK